MEQRFILRPALGTGCLLLVPLMAMRFTDHVAWNGLDFAVAGILLFGTGVTFELLARRAGNTMHRAALGLAVLTAFALVWVNLAVGLIGSEGNPVNLLYGGVLAVPLVGATITRLRPAGMARALFATALVQALVPLIALLIWNSQIAFDETLVRTLVLNAVFVVSFAGSGWLFRSAHPVS